MERLSCHPANPTRAALEIDVTVQPLGSGSVAFRYRVAGNVRAVRIPGSAPARRRDALWRRTCFEAFVRPAGSARYLELNFSPSTEWAAYAFARYREPLEPPPLEAPAIQCTAGDTWLELQATVRLDLPGFAAGDSALGLAAVIEDRDGRLSYWALMHPRAKPDFHDAGGWTARLAAAARESHA